MRGRLLKDPTALADYEIIEMLLFLGVPRRDTKPLAKGLIIRFGGYGQTLTAEPNSLRHAGLPSKAVNALKMVADAAEQLTLAEHREPVTVGDHHALGRYLADGARPWRQGWSVLLLGTRNQILAERPCDASDGPSVAGQVLREALMRHATAVILVRGSQCSPEVTDADRTVFRTLRERSGPLSVAVHDLVVVGSDRSWRSLVRCI